VGYKLRIVNQPTARRCITNAGHIIKQPHNAEDHRF